jgi:hypothetical protein
MIDIKCPASVRCARPTDENSMMDFLRLMHEENGMFPMDNDKVRGILRRGIQRDRAIVGIIRGDKGIEASVGLYVGVFWYAPDTTPHIEDLWTFVREDCRRTSHAKDLLAFSKWASSYLGFPLLMGILSNDRTAAKVRLYERQLGRAAGALFVIGQSAH